MSSMIQRFARQSATSALACVLAFEGAVGNSLANCNADAILVFDASASMASVGQSQFSVPRIEEAREAIRKSAPEITPWRRVGLIVYGPGTGGNCDNIELRLAPTANAAARIIAAVEATAPDGGTPLTRAVQDAAEVFDTDQNPGVVVLVTDGAETCGGKPCQVAAALAKTDVTIHVIGFRLPFDTLAFSDHTAYVEKSDLTANHRTRLHTETRCLADQTDGQFVTADSTDDLAAALREVLTCPVVGILDEF